MNNHIAFPGLGLEFNINPVAFSIGSISVQWYGIIICTGIIAAFLYFLRRASKTEGIHPDHVYNITLISVVAAIVGARLLYVITNLDNYDTFLEMISIPSGGLAIYGAVIFGGVAFVIYSRIKKLNTYAFMDSAAPAVLIGQIIGRWGNFVNAEAYGYSEGIEKLPWRMKLNTVYIDGVYRSDIEFVHPTFLYESLWNLIGLILIVIAYKKKRFDGQIILYYIAWYGLGRGFIEMLRSDSLRVFDLKLMVILGFATCAVALLLLPIRAKQAEKERAAALEYESKYAAARIESESADDIPVDTDTPEAVPFEHDGDYIAEDELVSDDKIDKNAGDEQALSEQDKLDE